MTSQPPVAPSVTLKSVVSGRSVSLKSPGAALVLVFTTQGTTELVGPLRLALRGRYPDPEKVVIASVINLKAVPRLMRKVAEGAVANRYKEVAATLAPGQDPKEYVVMLPDWKGEVAPALGFGELTDHLGVAVIAAGGRVAGTYAGPDPLEPVARLLESAGA